MDDEYSGATRERSQADGIDNYERIGAGVADGDGRIGGGGDDIRAKNLVAVGVGSAPLISEGGGAAIDDGAGEGDRAADANVGESRGNIAGRRLEYGADLDLIVLRGEVAA